MPPSDSPTAPLERAFLARLFYRRGGMTIAQCYVDAKSLGANADWFDDPSSRVVWLAAEQLFSEPNASDITLHLLVKRANAIARQSRDKEVNSVVIGKEFFDKSELGVSGVDGIAGFAKLLRNAAIKRKCMVAFQNALDSFNNEDDAVATAAKLVTGVQGVMNGERQSGRLSVASLADEVVSVYDNAYHHVQELGEENYTPGLPLPWRKLAFTLNGFPSVMTVVAARPGVGKTSFAVEMMRYWMDHGIKVVFDSLDMAGVEFMKRQLAEISQISSRKLQFGKSVRESWEKYDRPALMSAVEKVKKWEQDGILTLFTEPDIDVLKANVKILKDQGKVDVLVVDYIQLMGYRGAERQSRQQVVTRVSNMLHAITTELGIPVLALSQINRDSSKEGVAPQLHDIKDSGAIEQDASNVIILHPNWTLKKTWKDNPPTAFMKDGEVNATVKSLMPMWVIVAKSREGDANTEIPFVVVQNKYSWYQADYQADTKDEMFARVWPNWKHDSIEKLWEKNGALIDEELKDAIERKNATLTQSNLEPTDPPPSTRNQQQATSNPPPITSNPQQATSNQSQETSSQSQETSSQEQDFLPQGDIYDNPYGEF